MRPRVAKNLVPFLDMAYQGFGDGIDEDAAAVRLFAETGEAPRSDIVSDPSLLLVDLDVVRDLVCEALRLSR